MATNIKPLHDRVIVKRIEEGEQVRGGIIIPDSAAFSVSGIFAVVISKEKRQLWLSK